MLSFESMQNDSPEGQFDIWDPSEHLDLHHHHPHNNHHLWGNYNNCYSMAYIAASENVDS